MYGVEKMSRIFIIGQCSMHWGRMEFGNIGNYYIVSPMFEELRRVFPHDEIVTTMQFSECFCQKYNINTVPLEIYYDFGINNNLEVAKNEYISVCNGKNSGSVFVEEVQKSDLVIDFSGDLWGDNADFLGKDRFYTGIYKDLTAQQLKPTVMIAGSPGPFKNQHDIRLIKKVLEGFKLIINREPVSTRLLKSEGFSVSNMKEFACPSFLFKGASKDIVEQQVKTIFQEKKLNIGFIMCGWNFEKGPFDLQLRANEEYSNFVLAIENLINKYEANIYLLSHSNGFKIPPEQFELIRGRDFPIIKQLKDILDKRLCGEHVYLFDGIYTPEITKGIISNFDMLVSGRMHGAVAGISQCIPTVIMDYGHEPKAHKLLGFAEVAGMTEYIANPIVLEDLISKTEKCVENIDEIRKMLKAHIPCVQKSAKEQFDCLIQYIGSN